MNIHATLATVGKEAEVRSSSARESRSTTDGAAASKSSSTGSNSNGTSNAGPAATVSISSDARTLLRQAGVSPSEISRINLNDKNAVMRAIQRARMQRGQHANPGKAGATASEANPKNASAASRDAATTKSTERESATETRATSTGDGSKARSAA